MWWGVKSVGGGGSNAKFQAGLSCLHVGLRSLLYITNKVCKESYIIGQDNAIYTFFIELSLSSKGQNKSKLQKQISNVLISTVTAA